LLRNWSQQLRLELDHRFGIAPRKQASMQKARFKFN
jgi:hypothetical protein